MRIRIEQAHSGAWLLTPQSGKFCGKVVAIADGISMRSVTFEGAYIYGEVRAVYGLVPTEDLIFHDPDTIKGLGIGGNFIMQGGCVLEFHEGEYDLIDTGFHVTSALSLWVMKDEMQAGGCTV